VSKLKPTELNILPQLLSTEDIIQEDSDNRKQLVFNCARGDDDSIAMEQNLEHMFI